MLSRLSVKKPYTVIVGVILVLILGYVSLTKMTTDLLPSMNLPYAVVYTIYPGASPEEVETAVTRPVESSMATISNIENIQSVSAENVSIVILEFAETANMDSVTIEMRESLDQISSTWEESVGSPIIMKLNPDMMPIMTASVDKDGLDSIALTNYVENTLLAELESIEGVASVSTSGGIEETLQVILTEEKIAAKNEEIRKALDEQFADAREEMEEAKEELEEGLDQIESGAEKMEAAQAEIKEGQKKLTEEISKAKAEANAKKAEILETKLALTNQISELTAQLAELETGYASLKEVQNQRNTLLETKTSLETAKKEYQALAERYVNVKLTAEVYEQQIQAVRRDNSLTEEEKNAKIAEIQASEGYVAAQSGLAAVNQQLQILGITPEQLAGKVTETELALVEVNLTLETINYTLKQMNIEADQLDSALAEMTAGKEQLEAGIQTMKDTITQLEAGQIAISEAEAQIAASEAAGNLELYSALAQTIAGKQGLESTKAQLESGLTQLETAEDEMETAEKDAYRQADLNNILTREMVAQILQAQNFSMPAGYIMEEGTQMLIRVGDKFEDAETLENLILMDMGFDSVEPIRLGDVADVVFIDNSEEVYASINGNPGMILSMQKQTGYSTGEVADAIKEKFAELSEEEEGLHFTTLMDQGIYIDFIVGSVVENLLFGAVLAILVLIVFLKSIRPTLVVALSIPISLIAALALMYFSNISLNIISLSGLALGVGMLVDNSIVVIENIYRMRGEGVPVRKAAVEGAMQVSGAIAASTLTTCCVFLPIVFTEGMTKQLFVDMGLTITYSLVASLVVALTVVPMLSSGLLKNIRMKENRSFDRLQAAYSKSIVWILKHKILVILVSVVLLVASTLGAFAQGTSFMPSMESTQITVSLTTAEESTLQETAEISEQVIDQILTLEDVTTVGAMAGASGISLTGDNPTNQVTMYLILREDMTLSNAELKNRILELTADIPCEVVVNTNTMDMSALGGAGISLTVTGKELDTLQEVARDVAALVESVEGTEQVSDGMEETTPELQLIVDKAKASEYNLTVAQVFATVYAKLSESDTATTLVTESKDYPVVILDGEAEEFSVSDVKTMTMTVTNKDGEQEDIAIAELVDFVEADGLSSINRVNQMRTLSVTAAVDENHNVGLVGNEIMDLLEDYELPEGYSVTMAGENEMIQEAMVEMMKMLLLAVIFVYLVMVAQFQSLLSPFIIMFTLPLAFTGGFLGLILTGLDVSIIAMVGFVMLAGVIVNNGIVLVDYINQLRREGMEKKAAIAEAGRTRLRPILMTALTTILALVTMAMGMGMGADMVQPMAVVTMGGMIYGTFMTLWVIPCIYDLFNRKEDMTEEEI